MESEKLRELYAQAKYEEGLSFLETSSLKRKKTNRLLYLMEKGSLLYAQGNYPQAISIFEESNVLVDRLYTKSIKEKILSSFMPKESETFYGRVFERSMIYYYLSLSYYQEFRKTQETKFLNQSRATLLAWDSFFKEISRGSRTFLSFEIFHKVFAAEQHEAYGTRKDEQIALILYKDALKLLEKFGPSFQSFNKKFYQLYFGVFLLQIL